MEHIIIMSNYKISIKNHLSIFYLLYYPYKSINFNFYIFFLYLLLLIFILFYLHLPYIK